MSTNREQENVAADDTIANIAEGIDKIKINSNDKDDYEWSSTFKISDISEMENIENKLKNSEIAQGVLENTLQNMLQKNYKKTLKQNVEEKVKRTLMAVLRKYFTFNVISLFILTQADNNLNGFININTSLFFNCLINATKAVFNTISDAKGLVHKTVQACKTVKWKGPVFAPPYKRLPSTVKFYYNNNEMKLSQDTEEVATFYARMLDHKYTTEPVFNNNFFEDWKGVMIKEERDEITDLTKCNFKEMHAYFLQKRKERKAMTKEEKQKIKEKNDEIRKEYGFCTIDGQKVMICNFKIEPPGLFISRSKKNTKSWKNLGKLKKRVLPEDIVINCSKDSNIPKAPPDHKWNEIQYDPNVMWLAFWRGNINGKKKYIKLISNDMQKFEIARNLGQSFIDNIRNKYREDWDSETERIKQRAVALYFIDKLALRAGNEKDEDQADTVGCCSLRLEHIKLHEQKDGKKYVVVFEFSGKYSIQYDNEVPVKKRVYEILQHYKETKSSDNKLFDKVEPIDINNYLNEQMEGLTTKVFRTYNASWTLQQQLDKYTNPNDTEAGKILSYNRANGKVAKLLNHKRSVPKTYAKSMENLKAKIEAKKEAIAECKSQMEDAKQDAKHGSVKKKVTYKKKSNWTNWRNN